jgi:hypothetical protein
MSSPELLHLSNRLSSTEITLPADLTIASTSEEADVVRRAFAGRRWRECPWYLFDLDPSLVSAVERNYTVHLAWGYIASGRNSEEVLNRLADRVEVATGSELDVTLEVEVRRILSNHLSNGVVEQSEGNNSWCSS